MPFGLSRHPRKCGENARLTPIKYQTTPAGARTIFPSPTKAPPRPPQPSSPPHPPSRRPLVRAHRKTPAPSAAPPKTKTKPKSPPTPTAAPATQSHTPRDQSTAKHAGVAQRSETVARKGASVLRSPFSVLRSPSSRTASGFPRPAINKKPRRRKRRGKSSPEKERHHYYTKTKPAPATRPAICKTHTINTRTKCSTWNTPTTTNATLYVPPLAPANTKIFLHNAYFLLASRIPFCYNKGVEREGRHRRQPPPNPGRKPGNPERTRP